MIMSGIAPKVLFTDTAQNGRQRREILEIFQFDSEGRIAVEEMYADDLSLTRQLGVLG